MIPPHQRFHPDDFSSGQRNLWLEMKLYFAPADRAPQILGDGDALLDLAIQVRAVEAEAVAAVLFRAIEREVGLNHHHFGTGDVRCIR